MNLLQHLKKDLPASVVVFFVAVPLCLGIALASGAPLLSGLIAGIIGGVLVGSISGSPLGVSGPAAGLAVIVLHAIQKLGFEPFLLAVMLSGGIQVALGFARAGMLGYFFPSSVIKGMLAGIGVIILLKQLPHAVGYDKDPEGDVGFWQPDGETTLSSLAKMLERFEPFAILVAAVALAILLLWDKVLVKKSNWFRIIPGPLVAVGFGVSFQLLSKSIWPEQALGADHLVSVPVVSTWADFGNLAVFPDWSAIGNPAIWLTAITLAVVASLETLLCVAATDKLDPHKRVTPTNRELIAQGTGNLLSGSIGGLPITQVIVRSSANIQSGGQTKTSAILHGAWILLFVALLPQVLNLVPLAVLAAVLLVVGYKLAHPSLFRQMWAQGIPQFAPFVLTVLGIVFTDLLTGIGLGLALAILIILHRSYANSHFLHIAESDDAGQRHNVQMRLAEQVTFLNKGAILKELSSIQDDSLVTIDMSGCVSVDHDVQEVIDDFCANAEERGIEVNLLPHH